MELLLILWAVMAVVLLIASLFDQPKINNEQDDDLLAKWDELRDAAEEHLRDPDDTYVRHRMERALEALD